MILAISSALHGNDTFSKGYIMAGAALLYGSLTFLLTSTIWLSIGIVLLSVVWWFVFRGRKQAQVELKRMDTINYPGWFSFMDVVKAHYYTGWLTALALERYNYSNDAVKHLINNGKFWDIRRPAEIATGITGDIMLGLLLLGVWFIG